MSPFEVAFGLFSLVLGLAITSILEGLAHAIRARNGVRLGYLTPLLGVVIVLDLISFWWAAWTDREEILVNFITLIAAASIASTYYVSASLVFPKSDTAAADYDQWFLTHKQWVAGGIGLANALFSAGELLTFGYVPGLPWMQAIYIGLAAGLAITRIKWLSLGLMLAMLGMLLNSAYASIEHSVREQRDVSRTSGA